MFLLLLLLEHQLVSILLPPSGQAVEQNISYQASVNILYINMYVCVCALDILDTGRRYVLFLVTHSGHNFLFLVSLL